MFWRFSPVMLTGLFFAFSLFAIEGQTNELNSREKTADKSIVIVAGGDLGFGGSDQPISVSGGYRHGRLIHWNKICLLYTSPSPRDA